MHFVAPISASSNDVTPVMQRIHLLAADRAIAGLRTSGGHGLSAALVDVSIPPNHRPGRIEHAPGGDPNRSFTIAAARDLGSADALADAAIASLGPGEEVHVFVHGYNNTAAESVFRHAQIAHDYVDAGAGGGPQITFHWPSVARATGYVADRDAALAARTDLEALLLYLIDRVPGRVTLVGHSMGAFLSMETLARMSAARPGIALRLNGIVLVSPDIGIELFRSELDRVGPRPDRFVLTVSQADRALGLSAFLTRQTERLGSTDDVGRLRAQGITVIDLTDHGEGGNNHSTFAASPSAIRLIGGLIESGGIGR
ncbi:alpha/beta fold hydrolase [Jannaschia sp. Os4]|uniref:alpha/beta hydrolase n=1 Tax=Jannaschia sp. Os4 TaxID=2807617 RepID=UPI00193A17B4|nr:alpha/beta fold hydrolase [Jannaschia sp. Os4]MBM2576375.1 alpha/beta fold hydrolase [Jannaschia sp. Os4]